MVQNLISENMLLDYQGGSYQHHQESDKLIGDIQAKVYQLCDHPVYSQLTSKARIKCFISYHIFAVWDYIKLLKTLQNKMSIALRIQSKQYSNEMNKLLDEIIFAQASELYPYGKPNEDFAIYLRAMCAPATSEAIAEIEADSDCLWYFLESQDNLDFLQPGIKELVEFNLAIAESGTIPEIITVFCFGRELLSSQLFAAIIRVLKLEKNSQILTHYVEKLTLEKSLKYEILNLEMLDYLDELCENETEKIGALQAGLEALHLREQLWNYALTEITQL